MNYFVSDDQAQAVFSNILVMDDTVEVMMPQDSAGMQPLQVQPQEAFMTNLNNAAGQRLYVLQNNQLVVPQENQIIWMESAPIVTPQGQEKQAIEQVIQQRMKQQNMLRTLQQVSQPQRQLVQKPCSDEMVRMIGMHNSRLQGVQQQEVQQAKTSKPVGVDAAVGDDTPMELDDIIASAPLVPSVQNSKTPRPRLGPPIIRQQVRFPLTPRSAIHTLGPPLPDTHEQINIINDPKIIRTNSPKVEYFIRRQGIQPAANHSKSPSVDVKDFKVFVPTSTQGEYQYYNVQDASDRPRVLSATPQRPRFFATGTSSPTNVVQLRMGQNSPQLSVVGVKTGPRPNATPQRGTIYMPVSRPTTPPRANSPRQYMKSPPSTRSPRPTNLSHVVRPPQVPVLLRAVEPDKKIEKPVGVSETDSSGSQTKESIIGRRYVSGFLAICPFCGFSNLDFSKCERCKRRLPDNVKRQPIVPSLVKPQGMGPKSTEDSPATADEGSHKTSSASPLSKKKKKIEEPVVCVLSSDEEDTETDSTKKGTSQNSTPFPKEPVYTAEDRCRIEPEPEIDPPDEPSEPFTMMFHKALRVGNYNTTDRKQIYISAEGIHFTGTSAVFGSDVKVFIKKSSLKGVLLHDHEKEPMMFIYATRGTAARIRGLLGITNENFLFYDPCSNIQAYRRMLLHLETVTEVDKIVLENVLGGLLTVIDDSDKQRLMSLVHEPVPKIDETKLVSFNNFDLSKSDYACLADDIYLNDLIIDFYIQYLYERKLSPADRARTHIFSTFFYNRLTDNRENESSKDKPAEKRHKRVKSWTRKINIFEKDFIIIPINENSHWFLAVICFPYLTGPVRFHDNVPIPQETNTPKKLPPIVSVQIGNTTITHCPASSDHDEAETILPSSDRDEAEAEDDLSETEGDIDESVSNTEPPLPEIPLLGPPKPEPEPEPKLNKSTPIKQPCILIFDSLRGSSSRARVVATLRDYLTIEYKTKTGKERVFNKQNMKGSILRVPQQDNYSDCGIFVLQYVESFFENPLNDYRLPIRYLQYWFGESIHNKRREVAELIQVLMFEQGIDPNLINLPDLTARRSMSDELEEDTDMELEKDEDERDDDEAVEESCHRDNLEEGEIPSTVENVDQRTETQQIVPTVATNPTQLIQRLLPGHGPADGVTRQTLKSIRIQRAPVRTAAESDAKKIKKD